MQTTDVSPLGSGGPESNAGSHAPRNVLHLLPSDGLHDLIAGRGSVEVVSHLQTSERSWRRLQLFLLLQDLRQHDVQVGPLASIDEAWALLARAEQAAPDAVAAVVAHPQVGIWAAQTIRRIRRVRSDESPMWVHVGYLHALAAAAAIAAKMDFRIRVPAQHGFVTLPSLGHAEFPGMSPWASAEVSSDGVVARISSAEAQVEVSVTGGQDQMAAWYPLRQLQAEAGGHVLRVVLEDSDPYRNLRDLSPPTRLSDHSVAIWQAALSAAWTLLVGLDPDRSAAIAAGLRSIAVTKPGQPFRPLSASADDAFGNVLISEPHDAAQLAIALVHEFQHNKMGALQHLVDLQNDAARDLYYAPWRDDPRPLSGLLQGIYAFAAVTEFYRAYRHTVTGADANVAHFEFALWRAQTMRVLHDLADPREFSETGHDLILRLTDVLSPLLADPVPLPLQAAAALAAADHYARWRAHHLHPDPDLVKSVVHAYSAGEGCPPIPQYFDVGLRQQLSGWFVQDDPAGRWLDARAVLQRLRLTDPEALRTLLGQGSTMAETISGATVADALLATGDVAAAADLYLRRLAEHPGDPWAWTGMRLTRAATNQGAPGDPLQDMPELVCAVHRELAETATPVSPVELISWFAAGTTSGRPPSLHP